MNGIWENFIIYRSVKVGERGHFITPSRARKNFDLEPGDLMLVFRAPSPSRG